VASGPTLSAGYDGSHNWASSLKLDLSAIPAGSEIVSATLQLTDAYCLTGDTCTAASMDVYLAGSDVATTGTGPALVAAEMPNPIANAAPQSTWDITGPVQGWVAGGPNDRLVLRPGTPGAAGVSYDSPSANVGASSLPQVTIGYIPPVAPGVPASLSVTPGGRQRACKLVSPAPRLSRETSALQAAPLSRRSVWTTQPQPKHCLQGPAGHSHQATILDPPHRGKPACTCGSRQGAGWPLRASEGESRWCPAVTG
jgi:hypothetical protein